MKYVIVRCEDFAPSDRVTHGLLEGAKVPHLVGLAQAGAAGTIWLQRDGRARGRFAPTWGGTGHRQRLVADRLSLHGALLGLEPGAPEALPGRWYAASLGLSLADGETAWCCDLVTQQGGRIVDSTSGALSTTEGQALLEALNAHLGSVTRRWVVGEGSRHLLVVHGGELGGEARVAVGLPESAVGHRWRQALPKGTLGGGMRLLMEQASKVLEDHAVNRVRLDLGENPANLIWLWGPAQMDRGRIFMDRTGLSGAIIARRFPLRGLARSLGLTWETAPQDLLEESSLRQLAGLALDQARRHAVVYVHVPVVRHESAERFCAMERLDRFVLKPLTEELPTLGPWRLAVVVDDQLRGWVPFVAVGSGLPQHPVARLAPEPLLEQGLVFRGGAEWFQWLVAPR